MPQANTPAEVVPFRLGMLFPVAIAMILVGFAFVALGSSFSSSGSSGCVFWPIPFIVGCGFGSGNSNILLPFVFLAVFALATFFFWRFERARPLWP